MRSLLINWKLVLKVIGWRTAWYTIRNCFSVWFSSKFNKNWKISRLSHFTQRALLTAKTVNWVRNSSKSFSQYWLNFYAYTSELALLSLWSGLQIRIANSLYCEKKRRRSEFASLRFAENLRGFAFASLRFLDVQIRRIAKKFAESSQKIVLLFFLKDSNFKPFFVILSAKNS